MTLWNEKQLPALKKSLSHVLWIGGATDAGKTTTAALLAEKYKVQVYHGDQHWRENWSNITPKNQPAMTLWDKMSMDERWLHRSVESLTQQTLQIMTERFPFIVDDLLAIPQETSVVAEWFGFMPEYIAPLLSQPGQALWIFPDEKFKKMSTDKRGKHNFHQDTSNPENAWQNHLQRDLTLAAQSQHQAAARGLKIIINDAIKTRENILEEVESHFAVFLSETP